MYSYVSLPPEPKHARILKSAAALASKGETYEALEKLIQFCEHPENQDAEDRKRHAIGQVMDAITAHHDGAWDELRHSLQDLKNVPQRERRCPKRYRNGLPRMLDEFDTAMTTVFELTWDTGSCVQLLSHMVSGDWTVNVEYIKEAQRLFLREMTLEIPQ